MNPTFAYTAELLEATVSGQPDGALRHVSIDSRSLQNGPDTLFFALSGPHHDAHAFIPELIMKGVRHFVVSHIPKGYAGKAVFFIVPDARASLQRFAAWYRGQFHFPVIGITGSNGKTIVKEWLNFLLSPEYHIIRSPKSYNSQVGVPLSVLGINERHTLGIFEAGISTVGEMERLQPIIQPNIGIFTNIGSAHDEGFTSTEDKVREKMQLFRDADILIYRRHPLLDKCLPEKVKTLSWSDSGPADIHLQKRSDDGHTDLAVVYSGSSFDIRLPFEDEASIENACHCLAILLYMGYDATTIQSRLAQLYPVEMRLQVKDGIHGTVLIDDSYSSDFESLRIAFDFLESQKLHTRKTVILSDIFQSGLDTDTLYERLARLVKSNHITRVIGIGDVISKYASLFPGAAMYPSTDAFLEAFDRNAFADETILVKGARTFSFEKIVRLLEEKTHETVLEINLNALGHNLNFFRAKLAPSTKLMVMVKAFGYGNGGFEIAKLLEHYKADYLGVAFADEGIALKSAGIGLPIMVMNPETTSFASIIQNGLEPEIYSFKGLKAFRELAREYRLERYPIHIKIDTGMHRLGFSEADIPALTRELAESPEISVASILSHMATSDDPVHREFALGQISLFDRLSSDMIKALDIHPIRHILNTSGISHFPDAQYDMVRLGIGLYGISNDPSEQPFLENVGTLKSVISQLHLIPTGDSVGYGRRFRAPRETLVATIPIGYADGIRRAWGNGLGYVMINGNRAPIIGSVCMDMLMVDATGIACNEGDAVIIFGDRPTVIEMAEKLHTIPYEILVGISQRVKRVFYRE